MIGGPKTPKGLTKPQLWDSGNSLGGLFFPKEDAQEQEFINPSAPVY